MRSLFVLVVLALLVGCCDGFAVVPRAIMRLQNNVLKADPTECDNLPSMQSVLRRRLARVATAAALLGVPIPVQLSSVHPASATSAPEAVKPTAVASNTPLFDEVWGLVGENFFDASYNGLDWQGKVLQANRAKLASGGDERAVLKKALQGLGDKYTRLLDKKSYAALYKYDAIGVGLLFQSDPGQPLRVASPPVAGSAGEKAGIQKNDRVLSINGQSTEGMTALSVLEMMSNDERDSVTLAYARDGGDGGGSDAMSESESTIVTLQRSKNEAKNPVKYSLQRLPTGQKVGYIRFRDFNSEAVDSMRDAVVALEAAGAEEYMIDLRGNTGGGFQFALNIAGMFMSDRPMVTAAGRGEESTNFRSSFPEGVLSDKPLVLLTDGLSASASEVLAGGLRDNCRALTAGTTTFGKGKIQAVFGLNNGEGLVITVAQYVTPRGQVIQSKGIAPDLDGGPSGNAYMNLLLGSATDATPDLAAIDWQQVKERLRSCKPVE